MENPVNRDPPGLGDAVPLPEVPLYWSDFVWSLEKLRHRAYSRKMTERYVVNGQGLGWQKNILICKLYAQKRCHSQIILLNQCSDWYRINPLEMVLLGCQTLADDAPATRDVSLI